MIFADLIVFAAITFLCLFLIILSIDNKYKKTKLFLTIFSSIFTILQCTSLLTVMTDINYQFLVNLFDITTFIGVFKTNIFREYILMALAILLFTAGLLYFIHKKVKIKNNKIKIGIITICLIYLLSPYSLVTRLCKTMYNIIYNPSYKQSYNEVFKEITGVDFVDKKDIKTEIAGKQKNLVLIFLESIEQNFMNEKVFGNIAKDIKDLSNKGQYYYNIPSIEGSTWTSGAMHTVLCGVPEIYNIRQNKIFKTVTISNSVCLSDILNKTGYYQLYLGGEFKTFAGKSFFLELHKYDKTYGDKEVFNEYKIEEKDRWGWGAKDKDVFELAKIKYGELSKNDVPFNLTISTIDAHAPNGIHDERCKNSTDNSSLNAVECTNDLLKNFIDFLRKQDNYQNTLIVILPDHLIMTSGATSLLESIGERKLYTIILNGANNSKHDGQILYTDLVEIILKNMNIKHNAKFLLNNYKNQDVNERVDFINKNIQKIRTFNQKTIMQD